MLKSESKIQQEIVMYFRNNFCLEHHKPQCVIFAVPNADVSGDLHRIKNFSTGVLAGVSDLEVMLPRVSIYVEVKKPGGKQSPKQKVFQQRIEALGRKYYLVESLDDFKEIPEIIYHIKFMKDWF